MFHHVMIRMYLILVLLVFLLSTAHCDQLPDNDDAAMYGTQSVITVTNAYDTETNDPSDASASDTLLPENDETVSQQIGSVRTSSTLRTSSKPMSAFSDSAGYHSTDVTYPMTQNVANVDDRITRMYEWSEEIANLENSESITTPFPSTGPTLVDACDTDQVEVTINPMQINAFTNGTNCSLLITAPNTSTAVSVKLRMSGLNNVATYFYIEHLGNLPSNCPDQYLLVSVDHFLCGVVIGGNKFRFYFQNTETTLEISTLDMLDVPVLPCWYTDSPVFETKQCNATLYATKMEHKVEQFEFEYDLHSWPRTTLNVNLTRYLPKCVDLCVSCNHTLGYRERLSMCLDGKDSNAITKAELIIYQPAMKGLSFAYMGLHAIQPNTFLKLEDLEVLNLEHNSLLILPSTLCQNLPRLKVLILRYNMLTNLKSELLKGQCEQTLLRIDVNYNNLTYIANDLFNSTSNLRYLDISQNRLVHVSNVTFNTLTLLEHLSMSNNYISNLTIGVFDSLSMLVYLILSENNIASLAAGVFDSLAELRYLYWSDNNITSLPAGVFDSLGRWVVLP